MQTYFSKNGAANESIKQNTNITYSEIKGEDPINPILDISKE